MNLKNNCVEIMVDWLIQFLITIDEVLGTFYGTFREVRGIRL